MTQLSPATVKDALQSAVPIGHSGPGLGANPARFEGLFLHRAQRWLLPAQSPDHREKHAAQLPGGPAPDHRRFHYRARGAGRFPGQRQSWEVVADKMEIVGPPMTPIHSRKRDTRRSFCARSRICVRARICSAASFGCAAGSHSPFTSFSRSAVSFTFTRRSSPEAIAKAQGKCFASRRWIPKIRRGAGRRDRLRQGFFRAPDLSDRERATRGGSVRAGFSKVYTFGPTFRAENSTLRGTRASSG